MSQKLVVISQWMDVAEAKALVKSLVAEGKYAKGQVKLSSYRWKDLKDHDKGYLARVHAVPGICPELEIGETGRKTKVEPSTTVGSEMMQSEPTMNLMVDVRQGKMKEMTTSTGTLAA
jgi:hypothetical protein